MNRMDDTGFRWCMKMYCSSYCSQYDDDDDDDDEDDDTV